MISGKGEKWWGMQSVSSREWSMYRGLMVARNMVHLICENDSKPQWLGTECSARQRHEQNFTASGIKMGHRFPA